MKKAAKVLIVYAHPEPKSFCGAIKDTCVSSLRAQGREVKVSDLYAMKFFGALDKTDFTELSGAPIFNPENEHKIALERSTFVPEIVKEHEKTKWADLILFVYPLYWMQFPGVLKNWVDRVFTYGFAHGPNGQLAGKKGMMIYTTGAPREHLKSREPCSWRLFNDVFEFCGMKPLEPYVGYAVSSVDAGTRSKYLADVRKIMDEIDTRKELNVSI